MQPMKPGTDEDEAPDDTPSTDALLSWTIGVAFGQQYGFPKPVCC